MALLIDGLVSGVEEVVQVDSGVIDVARAECISVDDKLNLAQRDCELRITQFVVNNGLEFRLGVANQNPRLDRIVVTDGLKRWFCLHMLQLLYSDAYYRSLNDRYSRKYGHFQVLASDAWERYTDSGVAGVYNPIRRGEILRVDINPIPVGAGTYRAAIAWVDAVGGMGAASDTVSISIGSGEGFTVFPGATLSNVVAYNVYVGVDGSPLYRQNISPVELNSSYSISAFAQGNGNPTVPVQVIDFVLRKSRMFTRG